MSISLYVCYNFLLHATDLEGSHFIDLETEAQGDTVPYHFLGSGPEGGETVSFSHVTGCVLNHCTIQNLTNGDQKLKENLLRRFGRK